MNDLYKHTTLNLLLVSFIGAFFVIFPNIAFLKWELGFLDESLHSWHIAFFIFRYLFFVVMIWILLKYDLQHVRNISLQKRFLNNYLIIGIAWLVYFALNHLVVSFFPFKKADCFSGVLIFQFNVVCVVCTFVGHIFLMYTIQRRKEKEIEQLKIENLQSRCEALANQINPHFFFNSLNSLAALIRKKNDEKTLAYINTLSDVFRYILQSEKKGLVSLEEELEFVQAFRYMLEVRYASKLVFNIDIAKEQMDLKIPVLSLLPLIDNIIVHNTIDSEHKMVITILLNDKKELVVTNPIFPKLDIPDTNGTGIKNLENRFILLINKQIRVENDGKTFSVFLPLNKNDYANTDC